MKKYYKFSLLLIFVTQLNFSQNQVMPGAVTNPYFWLKAKKNNSIFTFENKTINTPTISVSGKDGGFYNFNPSIVFDGDGDQMSFPLTTQSTKKQTFFLVYKVKDSIAEQYLWQLADNRKTFSIATNKRLVDLDNFYYQSYNQKISLQKANIHFYQHNKADLESSQMAILIGSKPIGQTLPPVTFKGVISEILVYDRVLSSNEAQKVASYLSIKYGITLSQTETKNYLNSLGEIIWDESKHKDFQSAITAIGRDDNSGLLQTKSTNNSDENFITFELKPVNKIPDNYFVFWSDNSKKLNLKKQDQGQPIGIDRIWKLDYKQQNELKLNWIFDPKFIKAERPQDTFYWLLIDKSGKGTFEENTTEYVKLQSTDNKNKISLDNYNWDTEGLGKVAFTIKVAPAMFAQVWTKNPLCGQPNSGSLHFKIEGGKAPFTITVTKKGENQIYKQWIQEETTVNEMIQLDSGSFDYQVRDALGVLYNESLFITNKNAVESILNLSYNIVQGENLILDASLGLPAGDYQYEWLLDGKTITTNPTITIGKSGEYELRINDSSNCVSSKKIIVNSDLSDNTFISMYPNPSIDGHFNINLSFPKATDVKVAIYSITGSLIKETQLKGQDYYNYQDILNTSGMYLIKINYDYGTQVYKLIVK